MPHLNQIRYNVSKAKAISWYLTVTDLIFKNEGFVKQTNQKLIGHMEALFKAASKQAALANDFYSKSEIQWPKYTLWLCNRITKDFVKTTDRSIRLHKNQPGFDFPEETMESFYCEFVLLKKNLMASILDRAEESKVNNSQGFEEGMLQAS